MFKKREGGKNGKKSMSGGVGPLFLRRRGILQLGFLQLFEYVRCGILLLCKFCLSGYGTGGRLVYNRRFLGRVVASIYPG